MTTTNTVTAVANYPSPTLVAATPTVITRTMSGIKRLSAAVIILILQMDSPEEMEQMLVMVVMEQTEHQDMMGEREAMVEMVEMQENLY